MAHVKVFMYISNYMSKENSVNSCTQARPPPKPRRIPNVNVNNFLPRDLEGMINNLSLVSEQSNNYIQLLANAFARFPMYVEKWVILISNGCYAM